TVPYTTLFRSCTGATRAPRRTWSAAAGTRPPGREGGPVRHPSGDRSLDELLAAAAPVTDRDLDRPEVRAAARALIEELPMPDDPTAPKQAGDRPPLAIRPARDPEAGPADDLVVSLPAGADRPRRR